MFGPEGGRARLISDEHFADRIVRRPAVAEEAEHVDKKTGLGAASLNAIGAGESDFATPEILANLGGGSELAAGKGAFPVEDA